MGEIRRGIERLRGRDDAQAKALSDWLATLIGEYATRVLPVDLAIAERWGHLTASDPLPIADALIAATALEHHLTVATRNVRDMKRKGVAAVNPWEHTARRR